MHTKKKPRHPKRPPKRALKRVRWSEELSKKLYANKAHGGILRKKRKGRGRRVISASHSMHMVLRSSCANGTWSFRRPENKKKILAVLKKFTEKYEVKILTRAIVDDHIHLHMQFENLKMYKAFIRAVTSAIVMAVTGVSRWNKNALKPSKWHEIQRKAFWDHRPFTNIVYGVRHFLTLKRYIRINQIESLGYLKPTARWLLKNKKNWVELRLTEQLTI